MKTAALVVALLILLAAAPTPSGEFAAKRLGSSVGRAPVAGQLAVTEAAGSTPVLGLGSDSPVVAAARKEVSSVLATPARSVAPAGARGDTQRVPATLSGAMEVPVTFAVVRNGLASTYGEGWSPDLVAIPDGPGFRIRVCGTSTCLRLVTTDTGPTIPGRVVDLPMWAFERLCACDWRIAGLTPVSLVIEGRVP